MKLILKTEDNCTDFEAITLQVKNNKYYLCDLVNNNLKIKIKKTFQ
jgi:hypothetical protein